MSFWYALIPVGTAISIYGIRKLCEYQWGWVRNKSSLEGKIFIVTGANTGLGFETTKALVARGATVIMACRNEDRANEAVVKIRQATANGHLIVLRLDLSSFNSVKEFADKIKTTYPKFDCLINNAGMAVQGNQTNAENYELHFATNHLGHFLLTDLLKDVIAKNSARIVVVSSLMHKRGRIDFDNLGKCATTPRSRNGYYCDSKLANFYFARELYKKGFDVHVLCPGLCHTDFFRDFNPRWYHYVLFSPIVWLMLRSSEQGAQNIIHCATDNENTEEKNPATGYMVRNLRQTKSKYQFDDLTSVRLWEESLKMCGL
ncbi:retinol dehydrogenase 13-like [Bradysia coprophila]|uniref:retinol dehydrogenase 13-like n=1 Tax=Bradysia coprophila TaxID=38358 RepID=UPI00187DA8CC|nr:retinol dehydrogenase 13-like [Bradysia coprophila]